MYPWRRPLGAYQDDRHLELLQQVVGQLGMFGFGHQDQVVNLLRGSNILEQVAINQLGTGLHPGPRGHRQGLLEDFPA